MFYDLLTFFADTYIAEFGMREGPPLHDPIAVLAVLAPALLDDNGGERFTVKVFRGDDAEILKFGYRDGEDVELERAIGKSRDGEQLGRTLVRPAWEGVRIPRGLDTARFWALIELALKKAERESPMSG